MPLKGLSVTISEKMFLQALDVQLSTETPFIEMANMDMVDKHMWSTSLGRKFPGLQVRGCLHLRNV
jgi:hypothetical protein